MIDEALLAPTTAAVAAVLEIYDAATGDAADASLRPAFAALCARAAAAGAREFDLHEVWVGDLTMRGWIHGAYDPAAKTHPDLVAVHELPLVRQGRYVVAQHTAVAMLSALHAAHAPPEPAPFTPAAAAMSAALAYALRRVYYESKVLCGEDEPEIAVMLDGDNPRITVVPVAGSAFARDGSARVVIDGAELATMLNGDLGTSREAALSAWRDFAPTLREEGAAVPGWTLSRFTDRDGVAVTREHAARYEAGFVSTRDDPGLGHASGPGVAGRCDGDVCVVDDPERTVHEVHDLDE